MKLRIKKHSGLRCKKFNHLNNHFVKQNALCHLHNASVQCVHFLPKKYAGNPTQYGNKTYTWEGKFLTEVADEDGSKTQFEYDANGFRTQKRQFGTDGRLEYYVDYLWLDGRLTQQALTLMA